jgi:hypothetical protein
MVYVDTAVLVSALTIETTTRRTLEAAARRNLRQKLTNKVFGRAVD